MVIVAAFFCLLLELNESIESTEKQDHYDEEYYEFALQLASVGLVSVLPFDVCRFISRLHGERVAEELVPGLNELMLPVDLAREVSGSFVALLFLECDEGGHGLDDLIALNLDQVSNFLINHSQLVSLPRNY